MAVLGRHYVELPTRTLAVGKGLAVLFDYTLDGTMNKVINKIVDFFNWRKNSKNVFWVAIPLFVIAMSCQLFVAVAQAKYQHDYVYTYIVLGGLALLAIGLYHPLKYG